MRLPRFALRFCSALYLALACHAGHAAELGDAMVSSYIGQPLAADIELTGLADPGATIVVRNASLDVYRGANIALSPVLSNLALSVVRRDGRQFLHLSSTRPVDAAYLHLFLELVEGGKANVRGTTLWLVADPAPPPPKPVPVALAPPSPKPTPVAAPVMQAEPEPVLPVRKPVREITLGKAPPTCAQVEEQAKACAATEYKNGLLSAQVVELEEKVRQLQQIIDDRSGASASASAAVSADASAMAKAAAAASAASAASAHAPAKPAVPPPPPKAAKKDSGGFPWLLVLGGVAVLAAAGGGVFFVLKRLKAKGKAAPAEAPAAPPGPPLIQRLLARFKRKAPEALDAPPKAE